MQKFKYTLVILLALLSFGKAEALDIEYGSILDIKDNSVLIQYYSIGKKKNFVCSLVNLSCTPTKKNILAKKKTTNIDSVLQNEFEEKDAQHVTFSPDRNLVAYLIPGNETNQKRTYILKDLKNKIDYSISDSTVYWDLVTDYSKVFEFSPNNKNLVYLDDKEGTTSMYAIDTTKLSGSEIIGTKLPTNAFNITNFIFSDDNTIYYTANTTDNPYVWNLYSLDLKLNKNKLITSNLSYTDPIRKVGKNIIFSHLENKGYGQAFYNTKTKKVKTFKIPGISTKINLKNESVLKINNTYGVLMKPSKYDKSKNYSLLIWLHGGPLRQTSLGYHSYHSYGIYDSILELLRKNNVMVLKLDYRGSFGFGRSYSESISGNVGTGDIDDVIGAVSYMKNNYGINNVYLAGNSYGGYMSLKAVVDHPDTFTSIMSINGVTDWESLLVKMKTSIFNTQFHGLPSDLNRNLYNQASIINKIGNLGNQSISIVQGQSDRTIPPWQADLMYEKLKEQNKNVKTIKYAGEDHVFKEKKNISNLCIEMFNLLGKTPDKECSK